MARHVIPILKVRNLSVQYAQSIVLQKLTFELKRGEFVALVGKSGSGKTTILNAVAGFIPYTGKIERPRKVGMVFQQYAIFPWLTVAGNISFGLAQNKRNVSHYLEKVSMTTQADYYPHMLSGGQTQRVALARTLATNPDLILMDEPYGALDSHTREQMQQWLLDIWESERKTILFVTHSIEEAIFLADRILLLDTNGILLEFPIMLPRPRTEEMKFSAKFLGIKRTIGAALANGYGSDNG